MKLMLKFIRTIIPFVGALVPKKLMPPMLSCQEVAHILANVEDTSGPEYKKLRIHLFICEACDNYRKQILKINAASNSAREIKLTDAQLARIKAHQQRLSNK
jgi:hypothetical protein